MLALTLQVNGTFDMRLLATSKLDDVADVTGVEFGTHNVGPTPDPTSNDLTIRGGCLEFRCPGLIHMGVGEPRRDLPTNVSVEINTANTNLNCRLR